MPFEGALAGKTDAAVSFKGDHLLSLFAFCSHPRQSDGRQPVKSRSKKHATGQNAALHEALRHPLREKILLILSERSASPTELAEDLDEAPHRIEYHVGKLIELDCIELVDTDRKRGGIQHFYRATARPRIDMTSVKKLSRLQRESSSVTISQALIGDLVESLEARLLDSKENRTLLRMRVVVDDDGLDEIAAAMERCLDECFEIQARTAQRLTEADEDGFNVSLGLLGFPAGA